MIDKEGTRPAGEPLFAAVTGFAELEGSAAAVEEFELEGGVEPETTTELVGKTVVAASRCASIAPEPMRIIWRGSA